MIKIVQVFGSLDAGGAESRMMDVFRAIDRSKFEFIFVSLDCKDNQFYESEIRSLGGRVIKLPSPRSENIVKHVRRLTALFRKLRLDGASVVHAHTSYHCGIVLMAARLAGIPVRVSHARTTSSLNRKSLVQKLSIGLGKTLINVFATVRCALNCETAEALYGRRCYELGKVEIIKNAIDITRFKNPGICAELSGLPSDTTVIGHIGRFQPMKNHEFILHFFIKFRAHNQNSKLILVGDGPLRVEIEAKVREAGLRDDVLFLGLRSDIPSILARVNLFIFPSKFEGLPGSVIEAQASGIPALVSDNLTHKMDMELGLVEYLSLDVSPDIWVEHAARMLHRRRPQFNEIYTAFDAKGFTLENEIRQLTNIYENTDNNNHDI